MGKFIVFKLGSEEFGIDIKKVVEVLKSQKTCNLPELPDFVSGVMTVRGEVIPLVDMRKRFAVVSYPKHERVVIIRSEGEKVGIIVDEVMELLEFSEKEITLPSKIFKGLKAQYLNGLGKKEGRVVILLKLDGMLTSEEKIVLLGSKEAAQAPQAQ